MTPRGLLHSDIRGSMPVYGSPRRFVVNYVLRRLPVPRHPPCALIHLTFSSDAPFASPLTVPLPCAPSLSVRSAPFRSLPGQSLSCKNPFSPSQYPGRDTVTVSCFSFGYFVVFVTLYFRPRRLLLCLRCRSLALRYTLAYLFAQV